MKCRLWLSISLCFAGLYAHADLNRLLEQTCSDLKNRVKVVSEGVGYLNATDGRCMNYSTYDRYSTPKRDRRFFINLLMLRDAYQEVLFSNRRSRLTPQLEAQLNKIFPAIHLSSKAELEWMVPQTTDANSVCAISYDPWKTIDLAEAKRRLFLGLLSNNPHDDLEFRWGELQSPSSIAQQCPAWDEWTPDFEDRFE